MAEPTDNTAADPEKEAKIAAMKAKIEALKAQQGGGGASPAAASASTAQPTTPAQSAAAVDASTGDPEKDARVAAMKAKIEAAKAAAGGTAPAPAAAVATASTATAAAPPPKATAPPKPSAPSAPSAPKVVGEKPKSGKSDEEVGVWYFGRRDFMQSIGWMSFFGFLTIVILGAVRSMFPRVIYERPPIFKAGFPGDYIIGTVSEKYKDEERVWIIRQINGTFIALLAICTHLGCTPRFLAAENKFKCPCHGSGFRGTPNWGINFEGPAPRPLERLSISLAPDGQIEIDTSKKFLWENGQWEDPKAMLKV